MTDDISYLISHQDEFSHKIQKEANEYSSKTYNKGLPDLKFTKLHIFPDKENEYGFMFSTTIGREHAIGVKFKDGNIEKIGSSEIAFM